MKKSYLFLVLVIYSFSFLNAETEKKSSLSIGPYLGMKSGINGGSAVQGRKNQFLVSSVPDLGASLSLLINKENNLCFLFDLGYAGYSFGVKNTSNSYTYSENFQYLTLAPGFNFSYVTFHILMGIPLSADWGPSIGTENLNVITEVSLGAKFPLYEDETGDLNLFLNFSYMLSGIFKNFAKNDPLQSAIPVPQPFELTDSYNPRTASVQLGINYLFKF